jgi:hypothetical protein
MLWRATLGVVEGRMTLGDLVMINAFMIQLYIPLNFLGVLYREIKQSLTDLDKMFALLEREREVADRPARFSPSPSGGGPGRGRSASAWTVRFEPRELPLRPRPPHPARRLLRDPRRQRRWRWSALGRRASRRWRACCTASTTCSRAASRSPATTSASHAGQRAAGDRHRAAGHGAVQRHGRIQHRLRPPGREPGEVERRPAPPASTTSSRPRPGATRPWWASAA